MMYEEVEVPPEVQARVDNGWSWFVGVTSREMRDGINIERLNMTSVKNDVVAQAFAENDSERVLTRLGIDREESIRLGIFSPTDCHGQAESDYYNQLTAAWYRKLVAERGAMTAESIATADTPALLLMIENLRR